MFSSLYIHIPFCNAKCDYCAFYSLGCSTPAQRRSYLDKLKRDFRAFRSQCLPLQSIFLGGGTPTCLADDELAELLDAVNETFDIAPGCEWSCESTPESLSDEKIRILASRGVNRVSVGIQSFVPEERAAIGRRSPVDRMPDIMAELRANRIDNVNLDLIFLIPGQTPRSFETSLETALQYHPTHISAYALTLEPQSLLAKRIHDVDDTLFQDFWNTADRILGNAGLPRYEISNFAAPGRHCRHNDDIWHGATYLGCGPAATSFDGTDRFTQPPSLQRWLAGEPPERDILSRHDRACEILAFAMRTTQGWNWRDFQELTGLDPLKLRGPQLDALARKGLLNLDDHGAAPTPMGLLFNDDILQELI